VRDSRRRRQRQTCIRDRAQESSGGKNSAFHIKDITSVKNCPGVKRVNKQGDRKGEGAKKEKISVILFKGIIEVK